MAVDSRSDYSWPYLAISLSRQRRRRLLVSAAILERSRAQAVASSKSAMMCGSDTSESANSERRAVLRLSHRRSFTLKAQGDGEH